MTLNIIKIKSYISGIYPPQSLIPMSFYFFCKNKNIIRQDVDRWCECTNLPLKFSFYHALSYLLVFNKEIRNLYYRRLGIIGKLISIIVPGIKTLFITSAPIGGGFFIRHGYSTFINTEKIGDNCTVHQNTTIGDNGRGIPRIGNNVIIGTGAIVLGPITIGDDVTIGAGAIVVDDVPSNSTVVGVKAHVIKNNN